MSLFSYVVRPSWRILPLLTIRSLLTPQEASPSRGMHQCFWAGSFFQAPSHPWRSYPTPFCGVCPAPGAPRSAVLRSAPAGLLRYPGRAGRAVGKGWPPAGGAGGRSPAGAAPQRRVHFLSACGGGRSDRAPRRAVAGQQETMRRRNVAGADCRKSAATQRGIGRPPDQWRCDRGGACRAPCPRPGCRQTEAPPAL